MVYDGIVIHNRAGSEGQARPIPSLFVFLISAEPYTPHGWFNSPVLCIHSDVRDGMIQIYIYIHTCEVEWEVWA